MATKIDQMIEQEQVNLNQIQEAHNQKIQQLQQLQQEIQQMTIAGNAIATRINTLTEVRTQGAEAFRELDAETAHPEKEVETSSDPIVEQADEVRSADEVEPLN